MVVGLITAFVLSGVLEVYSRWDMSSSAQAALVILLIAATLWISEAVPLFVTSFVVLALGLVWLLPRMRSEGITVSESDLLAPFFSDVILLFLGGFVLSTALQKYRLDEQMARSLLARTGSRVPVMLLGVMATTAMLSMWLSNTATAAMMLALCRPIALRLPAVDARRKAILLAVPFSANIGGLGTPIGSPPNAIAMQYMQQAGFAPSFGMWLLIGVPGVFVMVGIAWVVLLLFFRGSQMTLKTNGKPAPIRWSRSRVLVVAVSAATIVGWVSTGMHGLSTGTVALFPIIAFFGMRILRVKDLQKIAWDVLFTMGGGLCLGTIISSSGLAVWMVQWLPVEESDCFELLMILGSAACLMSTVMSNTATANLLMPIILGLNVENLSPVLIGVAFACTLSMPLPTSTPPNAIVFSSGELQVKDIIVPGMIITAVGLVLALTTGHWWWDLVGLF